MMILTIMIGIGKGISWTLAEATFFRFNFQIRICLGSDIGLDEVAMKSIVLDMI